MPPAAWKGGSAARGLNASPAHKFREETPVRTGDPFKLY
jgi:hypothetical protein